MVEYQEDITDPRSTQVLKEKDIERYVASEEILKGAQEATDDEYAMTLWQGFDHAFVSGFFAFPALPERYGVFQSNGERIIPAVIQSGIENAVNAGEIIGLLLNGIIADLIGYRWVMIGCLILMICSISYSSSPPALPCMSAPKSHLPFL
ncbi:putative Major facilitator superfamily (MFS) profile domain-containing protein [Seiridium cardinale]